MCVPVASGACQVYSHSIQQEMNLEHEALLRREMPGPQHPKHSTNPTKSKANNSIIKS